MTKMGSDYLWVEKYRPSNLEEIVLEDSTQRYFENVKETGELGNLILTGPAGNGKSSLAFLIVKAIGAVSLYVNGSEETSIDNVRYKVKGFATTYSIENINAQKIVIIDEFCRLSQNAMDALKAIIEETSEICRFIFITNNIHRVIDPILSRCEIIKFGENTEEKMSLCVKYLKRMEWVLNEEGVEYDRKVLGKFIIEKYPDFRKVLGALQHCYKSNGVIDERILLSMDSSKAKSIIEIMKSKKLNKVMDAVIDIDSGDFFHSFYLEIKEYLKPECLPDVIILLGEYAFRDTMGTDKSINLMACIVELMKVVKWK